ncbi:10 TM acyl transferase domain found in Cas1p-domain-containing protein [Pyronema domesticum]|uniref:Similar to Probable O-acetyltransferase CAS1 acc. no. Q8X226 n=1 Tax=Pyronema omphalodes (strain CBS 100304) TaxID=1076935 RepID=U4LFW3_PYROM|nr:10 TM acyl transferase domain found in Cas1p-domain-containing protein [Pyronema domesticum]CCX30422.1 Similar to Probable O-acetyltransferase CAS1; acc. no. Q8X226 [Pyronema omphalodes CBS 100304]
MLSLRRFITPNLAHRLSTTFTLVTIIAVLVRFCFLDIRDLSKCGALLNEGEWLEKPPPYTSLPSIWQPPGCMIQKYKPTEAVSCFAGRRLFFAGDSTIRQAFWSVAQTIDKKIDSTQAEKHTDITITKNGVTLEFNWDPFLNGTRVRKELEAFHGEKYYQQDNKRPTIMLMGSGLWYPRFEKDNSMKKWRDNIDEIVSHMRVGRTTTDLTKQDLLLLAPVPVPAFDKLNDERKKTITPDIIAEMNSYLQQLSDIHGIDVVWAFHQLIQDLPQTYERSGLHLQTPISAVQADILLNLRCNAELPPKYPYDRTCCMKYEQPNLEQGLSLFFVFVIVPLMSYLSSKAEKRGKQAPSWVPSRKTIQALTVFGLAVVYCFYADRTQVFSKFHKQYTNYSFFVLTFMWVLPGLWSLKRTDKPFQQPSSDMSFMSREQTDEWKGWMQFAILVYHYTGASKVAWIYGLIRVAVASYLFMTGYGNAAFFYKKGDYSFKRVASMLIRLNLLSCTLPYMMGTDYLFYYFAPLVSFWFVIIYGTMRIGSSYNKNLKFLFGKIIASAMIVTGIVCIPGILEAIFEIPHLLAGTTWNVVEFRFRVFLDMWIVYVGMIVAIIAIRLNDNSSPYGPKLYKWSKYANIASIIALPLFIAFQVTRETKFVYNAYHPYISWIPIIAFVILRNSTQRLRNTYSGLFAWLGKCSLETFTLQFHIWMAADTKGLLDLNIVNSWAFNLFLTTVMFLFISHSVAAATGQLTGWIMGIPEKKPQQLPSTRGDAEREKTQEDIRLREMGESSRRGAEREEEEATSSTLAKYWGDLRVRCGAILVGLWVMNLLSSP